MKPTVMKFGGASLTRGSQYKRVAAIVAKAPGPRAVVASAMEGITDFLLRPLPEIRQSERAAGDAIARIRTLHEAAAEEALSTQGERARVGGEISAELSRLERLLYGISYTEELTPKTRDLAASFGERLSVRILAGAAREAGANATAHDADAIGIVTDGVFGGATPDLPAIESRFARELAPRIDAGEVPVITGYFG